MKIYQYECQLLTDVVISAGTASEGFKSSLDYIPGAKFLGIVAGVGKLYRENQPAATLDLFHNGTVRFGDAHPQLAGKYSLRAPFAWFKIKGSNATDTVYLHHRLDDGKRKEIASAEGQLKQVRNGYFLPDGTFLKRVNQHFSIKSAYDREKRRSQDAQMYGYFALPQGMIWSFSVEDQNGSYAEDIRAVLVGKHRVGRSRSAEYGLVEVTFTGEVDPPANQDVEGEAILYAESNLLFYDEYGNSTLRPDPQQHLGLPAGTTIDWSRSQLRTRPYQTWNRQRYNRDPDRTIIEKGSVLVCTLPDTVTLPETMWVGAQQAEGFGKLRVNPAFLRSADHRLPFALREINEEDGLNSVPLGPVSAREDDELVLAFLETQYERQSAEFSIEREVNLFIKRHKETYSGISSSQWGMVRNYTKRAGNLKSFKSLLFEEGVGALTVGQSEKDWRKNDRRDKLYEFLFDSKRIPEDDIIPFTLKLAAEMVESKNKNHE